MRIAVDCESTAVVLIAIGTYLLLATSSHPSLLHHAAVPACVLVAFCSAGFHLRKDHDPGLPLSAPRTLTACSSSCSPSTSICSAWAA